MGTFLPHANTIMTSVLATVAAETLVRKHVKRHGSELFIDRHRVALDSRPQVCVGAGKATARMANALNQLLERPFADCSLVVPDGYTFGAPSCRVRTAGHPLPDERSIEAGQEAINIARSWAGRDPQVFALISGGASALWCAPGPGLDLARKIEAGKWLLASGLPIHQVNTIRRRLSSIKGGRLAAEFQGAETHVLVLSDVPPDHIGLVGSGPFSPDKSSDEYVLGFLNNASIKPPQWLVETLNLPHEPLDPAYFARVRHYQIGSNRDAVLAALLKASQMGLHPKLGEQELTGEAAMMGRQLAEWVMGLDLKQPCCLVFGGETTVTLPSQHGLGGRNQELALAFSLAIEGNQHISMMTLATDGVDGPTDAAGAYVDGRTASDIRSQGLEPELVLQQHDSYRALSSAGALIRTGPTSTNVADLALVFLN